MTNRPLFGSHLSIVGGHHKAVFAARALGFDTVQVFTKNVNQWNAKPLTDEQVRAFRAALNETGIVRPVAHTSYLINLASPDDALWAKSIAAMVDELERAEALGIEDLVVHPGAHTGAGETAGIVRIIAGIDEVHRRTAGLRCRIDLETTAGQGTCLGARFEHFGAILRGCREPERLGLCVDTCHIFAAGYSFSNLGLYNAMIEEFDRAAGTRHVRVWHLNDSLREQGSRVDRHAGLGRGEIGLKPFTAIVNDPRFAQVPMILETPKGTENGVELDAINLKLLRGLVRGRRK